MCQDRSRIFLEVIGRQHMVVRRNKGLEVTPGAAGNQSQCPGVCVRDRQATRDERGKADPYGDGRGRNPENQEWRCHRPGVGSEVPDERRGSHRDDYASAHAAIGAAEIKSRAEVRLSCGDPLEQVPPTHEQTKQRSTDRVDHQPCLMRQKGYQEGGQGRSKPDILAQRAQMAACVDAGAARHDRRENRQ